MVAVALAVLVVGDTTIYRSQLRSRTDSPAHRFSFGLPASASVPLRDVMAQPRLVLAADVPARRALTELRALELDGAPVVNRDGAFLGTLHTARLVEQVAARPSAPVGRLADGEAMTVPVDAALDAAVDAVSTSRGGWVPVLDSDMRVVGIVAPSELVAGWRMAMRQAIRRLGTCFAHGRSRRDHGRQAARQPTALVLRSSTCLAERSWSPSIAATG